MSRYLCPRCCALLAGPDYPHVCSQAPTPSAQADDPVLDFEGGPEDFGGSDAESHYAAPAEWAAIREERERIAEKVKRQETSCGSSRLPIKHELKTWRSLFQALVDGRKTFELRKDDRDFQVGDRLRLQEWDETRGEYTGRTALFEVTYVTTASEFGALAEGFVCMGLRAVSRTSALQAASAEKALLEFRRTTKDAELFPSLTREAFDAGRQFEASSHLRSRPDDLLKQGWELVTHKTVLRDGSPQIVWIFSKGSRILKGEGVSDIQALDEVRRSVEKLESDGQA